MLGRSTGTGTIGAFTMNHLPQCSNSGSIYIFSITMYVYIFSINNIRHHQQLIQFILRWTFCRLLKLLNILNIFSVLNILNIFSIFKTLVLNILFQNTGFEYTEYIQNFQYQCIQLLESPVPLPMLCWYCCLCWMAISRNRKRLSEIRWWQNDKSFVAVSKCLQIFRKKTQNKYLGIPDIWNGKC